MGGSSLQINPDGTRAGESLWQNTAGTTGSGFGTSLFEQAPTYQAGSPTGRRQIPDVSMVADPATGLHVADTSAAQPLQTLGGTSLAAPIWAGLMALVNQARLANGLAALNTASPTETHQALYNAPTGLFNRVIDVTEKSTVTPPASPAAGLGSPVANQLVSNLANTRFSQVQAINTAIAANPATTGLAAATGSVHASPIASVQAAQPKPNRQPSPKPVVIKPTTPSAKAKQTPKLASNTATGTAFSQKLSGMLPKFNKPKPKPTTAPTERPAADIPTSSQTVDQALTQLAADQPGSQTLVDELFNQGTEEFWTNQVGYRKYLRGK